MRLDELLEDRGRLVNRHTVPVLMDTAAAARCVRAEEQLEEARGRHERAAAVEDGRMSKPSTTVAKARLDEAEHELDQAYAAAEQHMVEFAFESVGADLWDGLLTAHPPTPEEREKDPSAEYDATTFPLVAVAFSLADPQMPAAEIDAYLKALDNGETDLPIPPSARKLKAAVPSVVWDQIVTGAFRVNRGANRVPLSLSGSATTRSSGVESEPQ